MSASIPAGQSLFVPVAVALIPLLGWRETYALLGLVLVAGAVPVLLLWARAPESTEHRPAEPGGSEPPRPRSTEPLPPRRSSGPLGIERDVWLVGAGYFACGFTDQFVGLHWIALMVERGLSEVTAASFLSLMLVTGIAGSVLSGPIADRAPPHLVLAGLYLTRTACLPLLLLVGPGTGGLWVLGLFAVLFGSTYISNQAPGARIMRDHHGVAAVGRLMGNIGFAHQIGGAIGISIGGLSVAASGGYPPAILASAVVALVGGLLQLGVPAARRAAQAR
jgi:hypothetical protein